MPDLSKLPVPQYSPLQPYHWEFDNVPINNLALRDELINGELEKHSRILRLGAGTQGNMANRMDQSIDTNGNLKDTAIDEALHSIAEHTDASKEVDNTELDYINNTLGLESVVNPVSFVRMLDAERSKLSLVASNATDIRFQVQTPSAIVTINEGIISLEQSDSVGWDLTPPISPASPYILKPVLNISTDFAHNHYYDLEPITVDYQNYLVTSVNTPYIEGSLRVYINGIRINSEYDIYAPNYLPSSSWQLNRFTPNHLNGTFSLANPLSLSDIVRIDFNISLI